MRRSAVERMVWWRGTALWVKERMFRVRRRPRSSRRGLSTLVLRTQLSTKRTRARNHLFNPPHTSKYTDYRQSDDAQQAAVVAVLDKWMTDLRDRAGQGTDADWSWLCERTRKALGRLSPQNAVKVEWYVDDMLNYVDYYMSRVEDPLDQLPAMRYELKAKNDEIEGWKKFGVPVTPSVGQGDAPPEASGSTSKLLT